MPIRPDIFTNVHKGIRRALFETCVALGRAPEDAVPAELRAQLRSVLHFVRHHGENEDLLLLPMLVDTAPAVHARMRDAHTRIDNALREVEGRVDDSCATELYHRSCHLASLYVEHMREEEIDLEPQIRTALSPVQLQEFGRGSIARTAPADARSMLAWMLPAMQPTDARALLAQLPEDLQRELDELRPA